MAKLKIGKKSGLRYFGVDDLRRWKSSYDPSHYFPGDWRGTAVDLLNDARLPPEERLWFVLRTELLSKLSLRLFAVWCAKRVQLLAGHPLGELTVSVAERYANGQASYQELVAVRDAAVDAQWLAAQSLRKTPAADLPLRLQSASALRACAFAAHGEERPAAYGAALESCRALPGYRSSDIPVAQLIEVFRAEGRQRVLARASRRKSVSTVPSEATV